MPGRTKTPSGLNCLNQRLVAFAFVARFVEFIDMGLCESLEFGIADVLDTLWQAVIVDQGLEDIDELGGLVF